MAVKYVPRNSGADLIRKIVKLKTGKLPLPASKQVVRGVRIIPTVLKPVEDAETAIKEANANRLARAKFEQAFASDDPVVVSAMLKNLEDDGTAGAVLLMTALPLLLAKKQQASVRFANEGKAAKTRREDEEYCKIADKLRLKRRNEYYMAGKVRQELLKTREQEEIPSIRTIVRAFHRQNYC